jgi:hypothetical protein
VEWAEEWGTAEDGGDGRLEVFVTGDKKLRYQQNLKQRRIGIVLLSAQDWPTLKKKLVEIALAVDGAVPGSFQVVECGEFRRS